MSSTSLMISFQTLSEIELPYDPKISLISSIEMLPLPSFIKINNKFLILIKKAPCRTFWRQFRASALRVNSPYWCWRWRTLSDVAKVIKYNNTSKSESSTCIVNRSAVVRVHRLHDPFDLLLRLGRVHDLGVTFQTQSSLLTHCLTNYQLLPAQLPVTVQVQRLEGLQ